MIEEIEEHIFTEEEIKSVGKLVDILRRIDARLISEGYEIKNGVVTKDGKVADKPIDRKFVKR